MKNEIKNRRQAAGLNQTRLADMANISRYTLVNIERGKTNPSLQIADQIAKALQCNIYEIFPDMDSSDQMTPEAAVSMKISQLVKEGWSYRVARETILNDLVNSF